MHAKVINNQILYNKFAPNLLRNYNLTLLEMVVNTCSKKAFLYY